MTKRITILLMVLCAALFINAQIKQKYDIIPQRLAKNQAYSLAKSAADCEISNNQFDITNLNGGYYTIGTNKGLSSSTLDDNCQITYGHPFAKTSYPLFSVDGNWYKPDDYFSSGDLSSIKTNGDTITFTAIKKGIISVSFSLFLSGQDQTVKIKESVQNLDSKEHSIALGLVFDPGLGKNGDAALLINGSYITAPQVLQSNAVPSVFTLWEKNTGSKGIGVDVTFANKPNTVSVGNWNSLYNNRAPETFLTGMDIYDLLLKFYWPEISIPAGSGSEYVASVALKTPDFGKGLITRWDLPSYIDLSDNLMYPQKISSYVQIQQSASQLYSAPSLQVSAPESIIPDQTAYSYTSTFPAFQSVAFTPQVIYLEAAPEIVLKLVNGSDVIDEIHKKIFIPATPISDSGLVVKIDTLITNKLPKVSTIFEAQNKSTGALLLSLNKKNVLLNEDSKQITDFTMTKDTSGGTQAVDIVFALDVTGSMSSEIEGVKQNIEEFADSLTMQKISFRIGMVTFLDIIENIYPFTSDVQLFKQNVALQYAHGGGDLPENSLEALLDATRFDFRKNAKRIVIWITDASYHESDGVTPLARQVVIDSLLRNGIVVDAIGASDYKSSFYDQITNATGGNYFDINGNFRDILLSISRINYAYKYLLTYQSPSTSTSARTINLKVIYAGVGGTASVTYSPSSPIINKPVEKRFSFYPNPFNPEIVFHVNKEGYANAKIRIYNLLGQVVKELNFSGDNIHNVMWNAKDECGKTVSSGFYIASLMLSAPGKSPYTESAKILYLK